jgi:hypothetical protein
VVDEDAGELVADGALDQGGGDCGVDAAGKPADDPAGADLRLDQRYLLVDDAVHAPRRGEAGDVVEEVLKHPLAVLGVQDLRVELHAGEPADRILERGDRRPSGGGRHGEPGRRRRHRVTVGHPHRELGGQVGQHD